MIRQERRTITNAARQTKASYITFAFILISGLVMGSVWTYLLLVPGDMATSSVYPTDGVASSSNQGTGAVSNHLRAAVAATTTETHEREGWHPIHVFYGKREGLKLDPNKEWFAQVRQDEIVIDLLGENGYFIDLAANDAKDLSNTVALEKHGWNGRYNGFSRRSVILDAAFRKHVVPVDPLTLFGLVSTTGLCVEPNPVYWYDLTHRKCTVVGALVGGPVVEKVSVKFRGVFGGIVGKMDEGLANRKKEPHAAVEERYTTPFHELLQEYNVPSTIDYLSLDVEGAEFLIMQYFPFDQYTIKVLTVERPSADLKALLGRHGYLMLKQLAWWGETLWAHRSTGLSPSHPKIVKIPTDEKK